MYFIQESIYFNNTISSFDYLLNINQNKTLAKQYLDLEMPFSNFEKKILKQEIYNVYCSYLIDANTYFNRLELFLVLKRNDLDRIYGINNGYKQRLEYLLFVIKIINDKKIPRVIKYIYLYNINYKAVKKLTKVLATKIKII
jgi:hypothetical protein